MNKDLTVGDPRKILWQFCLPLFGSVIFQQLYNIADSLVAGKFIGQNALAAVGNSYEITLIFIAFAFGCNIGCSVVVSQLFGAREYGEVKTAVYTTFIACAALLAVLMTGGFLLSGAGLRAINTPQEIFADSALYLRIYVLGLPFLFFYNVATGIFSALGDSRTPFLFLAFSSSANIAVDVLFVAGLHMGVAGVAWATFLCQGVSCVLAVLAVLRRLAALPQGKARYFSLPLLRRIARIAIPSTMQQGFVSVGNIVLQGVINGFGPAVIAGYAAAIKLNNLVITSMSTIGNGISNYTAQNLGAGRAERLHPGFGAGLRMVWTLCVPLTLLYFFGGRLLLGVFLNSDAPEALTTGLQILHILSPFYCVVASKIMADAMLRGAGLMSRFVIATFADLLLRVGIALALAGSMGPLGIWCAWPVGWILSAALSLAFYRRDVFCGMGLQKARQEVSAE